MEFIDLNKWCEHVRGDDDYSYSREAVLEIVSRAGVDLVDMGQMHPNPYGYDNDSSVGQYTFDVKRKFERFCGSRKIVSATLSIYLLKTERSGYISRTSKCRRINVEPDDGDNLEVSVDTVVGKLVELAESCKEETRKYRLDIEEMRRITAFRLEGERLATNIGPGVKCEMRRRTDGTLSRWFTMSNLTEEQAMVAWNAIEEMVNEEETRNG